MAATIAELKERFPEEMALMEDANLRMTMGVVGIINKYEEKLAQRDEKIAELNESVRDKYRVCGDQTRTINELSEKLIKLTSKKKGTKK